MNKHCPISTKRLSTKRVTKPWMTSSLLQCVREKHRLYRLYFGSVRYIAVYNRYRNTLCNIIRKAKSDYYEKKFTDVRNNSVFTWKVINSVFAWW